MYLDDDEGIDDFADTSGCLKFVLAFVTAVLLTILLLLYAGSN